MKFFLSIAFRNKLGEVIGKKPVFGPEMAIIRTKRWTDFGPFWICCLRDGVHFPVISSLFVLI